MRKSDSKLSEGTKKRDDLLTKDGQRMHKKTNCLRKKGPASERGKEFGETGGGGVLRSKMHGGARGDCSEGIT